jgi:hypothetical protein
MAKKQKLSLLAVLSSLMFPHSHCPFLISEHSIFFVQLGIEVRNLDLAAK